MKPKKKTLILPKSPLIGGDVTIDDLPIFTDGKREVGAGQIVASSKPRGRGKFGMIQIYLKDERLGACNFPDSGDFKRFALGVGDYVLFHKNGRITHWPKERFEKKFKAV